MFKEGCSHEFWPLNHSASAAAGRFLHVGPPRRRTSGTGTSGRRVCSPWKKNRSTPSWCIGWLDGDGACDSQVSCIGSTEYRSLSLSGSCHLLPFEKQGFSNAVPRPVAAFQLEVTLPRRLSFGSGRRHCHGHTAGQWQPHFESSPPALSPARPCVSPVALPLHPPGTQSQARTVTSSRCGGPGPGLVTVYPVGTVLALVTGWLERPTEVQITCGGSALPTWMLYMLSHSAATSSWNLIMMSVTLTGSLQPPPIQVTQVPRTWLRLKWGSDSEGGAVTSGAPRPAVPW